MTTGIVCVDKPQDMTSFDACAILRRLLGERRIGHAGTLDPMATGVLPIMLGRATRAIPLLPTHDKAYRTTLRFGYTADTLDVWGTVTPTHAQPPSRDALEAVLPAFRGEILQIPPMVSALKKDGVRLYELARQGVEVEREPRPVTVYELTLEQYDGAAGEATLLCRCSAGTYIRTLCDDIGRALGCGAIMTALRRSAAAGYTEADCHTIDEWRAFAEAGTLEQYIRPVDSAFAASPAVRVSAAQATRFQNGGALSLERLGGQTVGELTRVYAPNNTFLGLGTPQENELRVVRIF